MFYIGTHETSWLSRTAHPLFISRRRLVRRASKYPPALGQWAMDSGGFTELFLFGKWNTTASQYAAEVVQYKDEIGKLEWAAIQDWMCEPFMIAKTGKSIQEHQELSVQSYLDLKALAPDIVWAPVLQGFQLDEYLRHAEMYEAVGVDLKSLPIVGVGSVCRRQASQEAIDIFLGLKPLGLQLHGFGLKVGFIKKRIDLGIRSCDSMAWSLSARRCPPLKGCKHSRCNNCFDYAMRWRDEVLRIGASPRQTMLF